MYIFVYGTLKRGFHNHDILNDAEFICEATTKDKYPMVNIEEYFPYLINDKGVGHNICGEVYKISTTTLARVDLLEGYPDLYTREPIDVISQGIKLRTIVYFVKEKIDYTNLKLLEIFEEN